MKIGVGAAKQISPKESWILCAAIYGNPANPYNALSSDDFIDFFRNEKRRIDKKSVMSLPTFNKHKTRLLAKGILIQHNAGWGRLYSPNWDVVASGLFNYERKLYARLAQSRVFRVLFCPYDYPVKVSYPHLLANNMFSNAVIMATLTEEKKPEGNEEEDARKISNLVVSLPFEWQAFLKPILNNFMKEYDQLTDEEKKLLMDDIKELGRALLRLGTRQFGMHMI